MKSFRIIDLLLKSLFLLLFLIILVPFLPYKFQQIHNTNPDQTKLKLQHNQAIGGLSVIEGNDKIQAYVKTQNLSPTNNRIYLTGNTPYNDLSFSKNGVPLDTTFIVYGNFTDNAPNHETVIFDVKEWFPNSGYISIKYSKWWKNVNMDFNIFISTIILVFLILVAFISKLVIKTKLKKH
ncbi:hypothetical protein SAMN02745163_01418 [Clostridium cavendishii DSM 21758]|uniref:Uncharacterized protein n=1 Tax=Clostridium cavendishii DSM 21758 TaxID=1121302 RepID=A0A1M6GXE0_9CLOT|nr:hypothetical protein [Clostridium cavendishii]SHJ14592.1 hypothetical protein SAMN02745163_01418 [Clostridium cavendishii DSM 21758]